MRQIYLILLLATVYSFSAHAQYPGGGNGGGQRRGAGGGNMTGRMYGKIVDEKTNKGIDAATIQLIQSKFDKLTRK